MILSISQLHKSFGSDIVFEDAQFIIKGTEKIALVGRNGSGKTTLMNILSGLEPYDKAEFHKRSNLTIGFLEQMAFKDESITVNDAFESIFEEVKIVEQHIQEVSLLLKSEPTEKNIEPLSQLQSRFEFLDGYTIETQVNQLMSSFGFEKEDLTRKLITFSGGQKTRLGFIKMLLSKPDVLLLDEPTNHLDIETIEWLEGYLLNYPAAIVLTSHDRLFLDRVCSQVAEINQKKIEMFKGNYSSYLSQKEALLQKQQQLFQYQQKEIERLETLIEKFRYKKNKAAFAKSKQKYLDRLDRIESPSQSQKAFKAHFVSRLRGGNDVLTMDECQVGYDEILFKVSLELKRGQRMAILGNNGTGKSTLLKSIIGHVDFLGGEMLLGHQIENGYFEQNLDQFNPTNTILEELWDDYPNLNKTQIRTVLGTFLFSGDDVFKSVSVLSGGEKVRLALCKLMLKQANFLILDEPTNHLDIESKEALEKALLNYDGTILFVSHDRYFIEKIANSILKIDNREVIINQLDVKETLFSKNHKQMYEQKEESSEMSDFEKSNEKRRLKKNSERLLLELEDLHIKLDEHRELRFDPEYYHDFEKMKQLDETIDAIHNEIAHCEAEWSEIEEKLESFKQ